MCYVYQFIFPNGKQYIGMTTRTPNKRWANGKGYENQVVGAAIKKYGWENVIKNILATVDTFEEACALEEKYILTNKTFVDENGYNVAQGGETNARFYDIDKVKSLWEENGNMDIIVQETGYSLYKIRQILDNYGIDREARAIRKQEDRLLLERRVSVFDASGVCQDICESIGIAAKRYQITVATIKRQCENDKFELHGLRFRYYKAWKQKLEPLPEWQKQLRATKRYYKNKLGIDLKELW